MNSDTLAILVDIIKHDSGIALTSDKSYLLESRLSSVIKKYHIKDINELAELAARNTNRDLRKELVDAMTTNESFFFRDGKPFDQFQSYVIEKFNKNKDYPATLRVWCAACSTGQEPYSIAMILRESSHLFPNLKCEILATDISAEAISKAKKGVFSQFEVQRGLTTKRLLTHFSKKGDGWEVSDQIRRKVEFRNHNLIEDNLSLGSFDVIFIRNVLIYFEISTKKKILDDIASMLRPAGYVCLGGTETILGITDRLRPLEKARGMYFANTTEHSAPNSRASCAVFS